MTDDDRDHARALVKKLLAEAQERASAGTYADALTAVRKARALDQTNIYVLALERQIEQLDELSAAGGLSETQRSDILDSLPGIIAQAERDQAPSAGGGEGQPGTAISAEQEGQRRAAQQWLKNQYFQRAHEYVRRSEYDHALAELRRVFIVDEKDRFAREFELKILQMQELQRRKPLVAAARPPQAPAQPAAPPTPPPAPEPLKETRANRVLAIALAVTFLVVAFAFYYFWKRDRDAAGALPETDENATESVTDEPFYPIPQAVPVDSTRVDTTGVVSEPGNPDDRSVVEPE